MRILESIVLVHTWGFPCPLNRWEAEKSHDFSDFWVDALEIEDFCWKRQTSNFTHIYLKTWSALRQVQHSTRSWNCERSSIHSGHIWSVILICATGSTGPSSTFFNPLSISDCNFFSCAMALETSTASFGLGLFGLLPCKSWANKSEFHSHQQPRSKARTNVIRKEDLCWSRYPFEDLCEVSSQDHHGSSHLIWRTFAISQDYNSDFIKSFSIESFFNKTT